MEEMWWRGFPAEAASRFSQEVGPCQMIWVLYPVDILSLKKDPFKLNVIKLQACAYELEWSPFQDSEETTPYGEINDTSYESQADFHWDETIFFLNFEFSN